jgi:hypothetical protein
LRSDVGPVVVAHDDTPVTPVINQVPEPVGAAAPEGPEAVAVKVIVDPSVAVVALATTETVGTALLTEVVVPEVAGVAK